MKIAFRADSSEMIGTGHIYRCMTLAEEFRKKKINSVFICQKFQKNLIYFIKKKNFKVITVNNNFNRKDNKFLKNHFLPWSKEMQTRDFKSTFQKIGNLNIKWILIDHYGLSEIWEKLASNKYKVAVIDDLKNRNRFCDLYINYHYLPFNREHQKKLKKHNCKKLTGINYSIVDKIYCPEKKFAQNSNLRRKKSIFVFMGGVDRKNYTYKIFQILKKKVFSKFKITILIGLGNLKRKILLKKAQKVKNIKLVKKMINKSIMKKYYINSDLVISPAGVTMYEQLLCGANSLIIPQNFYQKKTCYNLSRDNYINYESNIKNINIKKINFIINNKKKNKPISIGNNKIVDIIKRSL